ncbi:MAG: peptidoglycan-associated lipoprotein Pal [Gemmatimonadota bacterium]
MASIGRKNVGWLLGAIALTLVIAACGGGTPEAEPEPEPQVADTRDAAADSAARAAEAKRRAEAEEARRREAERDRVVTIATERVFFDFDKSNIRADAEPVLQRKVSVLREYPDITIRIEGNCDDRGSVEYNLALGQRRAEAVRRYLISYGLDTSRFTVISYGEERPLDRAQDEKAWAQNRRDDFVITNYGRLGAGD